MSDFLGKMIFDRRCAERTNSSVDHVRILRYLKFGLKLKEKSRIPESATRRAALESVTVSESASCS